MKYQVVYSSAAPKGEKAKNMRSIMGVVFSSKDVANRYIRSFIAEHIAGCKEEDLDEYIDNHKGNFLTVNDTTHFIGKDGCMKSWSIVPYPCKFLVVTTTRTKDGQEQKSARSADNIHDARDILYKEIAASQPCKEDEMEARERLVQNMAVFQEYRFVSDDGTEKVWAIELDNGKDAPEPEPMPNTESSYKKLRESLIKAARSGKRMEAFITFRKTESGTNAVEDEKSRTYIISSREKAFNPGMSGYSIFGTSLDKVYTSVRLDQLMREEKGTGTGWEVEKCGVVKFQLLLVRDRDLFVIGYFDTHTDANRAMWTELARAAGCDNDVSEYISENMDKCGFSSDFAWLRKDGQWDWNIVPIFFMDNEIIVFHS